MAYTTIDDPTIYFNTKLYTGDGSTQSVTGVGFQPDWVWIKNRDSSSSGNILHDVIRGAGTALFSNSNSADNTSTAAGILQSFDSDGFTVTDGGRVNSNTNKYVSWNWKAGGSASSNEDGDITSSVSANTTAGFSIVSYTGSGSNATVGHGLGVAPAWYIVKQRNAGRSWNVYHKSLGATKYILLENTAGSGTDSTVWNDTGPTSTTFSVGTTNSTNASSGTFIAYCFAEKKGYSKFGSYTGNGNADGPFIYTGFKPAYLLLKESSSSGEDWVLQDNKRDTVINPVSATLYASASNAENTGYRYCDFNANGFKIRNSQDDYNTNGSTYIFIAFAESPFVNSNGLPNNAR